VNSVLIGGIGNVLLGDDAIGPYVIRLLESSYEFDDNVEIADLGTPALDLTHRIAGRDAVILIDCVASNEAPGTLQLFRKDDILRTMPAQRLDPHSPALAECLLTAEMLGAMPQSVLLIGIVGATFEPGLPLTDAVREAATLAVDAILKELQGFGITPRRFLAPASAPMWWSEPASA
jgi:hydrogenase maturation protease